MMMLILFATGLALLLLALVMIAGRTAAMVRNGSPLLAIGPLRWETSALARRTRTVPPSPAESRGWFTRWLSRPGLLRSGASAAPVTAPEPPVRERSRKLASFSALGVPEPDRPGDLALSSAMAHVAATESRIEAAFDEFCAGSTTLAAFAGILADEDAELHRLRTAATSAALIEAIDEAAAVVAHCSDWAAQQDMTV